MFNNIVVDSACDINNEAIGNDICTVSRVPLNLELENKVYLDDENLDLDDFLHQMESSTDAVKTSAPAPGLFLEKFKLGENVFAVTLSSKLSAT